MFYSCKEKAKFAFAMNAVIAHPGESGRNIEDFINKHISGLDSYCRTYCGTSVRIPKPSPQVIKEAVKKCLEAPYNLKFIGISRLCREARQNAVKYICSTGGATPKCKVQLQKINQ